MELFCTLQSISFSLAPFLCLFFVFYQWKLLNKLLTVTEKCHCLIMAEFLVSISITSSGISFYCQVFFILYINCILTDSGAFIICTVTLSSSGAVLFFIFAWMISVPNIHIFSIFFSFYKIHYMNNMYWCIDYLSRNVLHCLHFWDGYLCSSKIITLLNL